MNLKPILNQKGQGLTEYLILLLLISLSSVTLAKQFGGAVQAKIKDAKHHIDADIKVQGANSDDGNDSSN